MASKITVHGGFRQYPGTVTCAEIRGNELCKTIDEARLVLDRWSSEPGFSWGQVVTAKQHAFNTWLNDPTAAVHHSIGDCPAFGNTSTATED